MAWRLGALHSGHRKRIREILDATDVFREEEIEVALELFDETFAGHSSRAPFDAGDGVADYEFVGSFAQDGQLAGYVCYGATPGADRTYDLYWIAVHPSAQGSGGGTRLIEEVERRLRERDARLLIVETSARDDYAATRQFYAARGYAEAARLSNYYAPGDDRVIFTKRLSDPSPPHDHAESARNE